MANIVLKAGTNIIGKVGIDQTAGQNTVAPAVSMNTGTMDATTQRVTLATDGPTVAVLGATTDAAVSTDASGSVNAHLRGLVKLIVAKIGTTVADGDNAVEGLTTDAAVAAGALGTISAKLRRATQGLEDLKSLIVLAAGEAHLGSVGGSLASVSVTFTRPADTTAYAALDAVSNSTSAPTVLQFTGLARVTGGSGYVVKAQLMTDLKTDVKRYRLHLFNAAPTAINDNSPYLALYANAAARVGTIDFAALATEDPTNSTTAGNQQVGNLLPFVCAADANLYGLLETLDAGTPASAQSFTIKLGAERN